MEKLNVCLSSLKAVKDGHVSKSRVDAVAEAALRALRHGRTAGEVAEALILHCKSSSKEQRLAALYALHEAVWTEKKKLEDKNLKHRTEKRGALSIALEQKVESVMALFRDTSSKDREQISKIVQKWSERFVFPAELCRKCAQAADCAVPSAPTPSSPPPSSSSAKPSKAEPPLASPPPNAPAPISLSYKPVVAVAPPTIVPPPPLPSMQPLIVAPPAVPAPPTKSAWGALARPKDSAPVQAAAAATTKSRWDDRPPPSEERARSPPKRSRWAS